MRMRMRLADAACGCGRGCRCGCGCDENANRVSCSPPFVTLGPRSHRTLLSPHPGGDGAHRPDDSPFDVRAALDAAGVDPEYYLAVRITLESFSRDALPVVQALGIQRSCSNPFS